MLITGSAQMRVFCPPFSEASSFYPKSPGDRAQYCALVFLCFLLCDEEISKAKSSHAEFSKSVGFSAVPFGFGFLRGEDGLDLTIIEGFQPFECAHEQRSVDR